MQLALTSAAASLNFSAVVMILQPSPSSHVHVRGRFDLPRFYAEAHRVLRPGGVLAAWGYDLCKLNDEDADK
jgi:hypothetical protein